MSEALEVNQKENQSLVSKDEEGSGEAFHDLKKIWSCIQSKLQNYLSEDVYLRWFQNAELVRVDGQHGVVGVTSDMQQIWVETNYLDELRAAFAEGAGIHCSPAVVVLGQEVPEISPPKENAQKKVARGVAAATGKVKVVPEKAGLSTPVAVERKLKKMGVNPEFSFESFVVGQNSQFAHAACSAVATREGRSFNPLFIHGRPGLGKTHLMSAIAQQLMVSDSKVKVVFLTAEQFANEFIEAVRKGSLDTFRKAYRNADVMLIDDIQFLGGKERTQDEFFHTFSTLLNLQTQIVLTSDRPAHEIQTLEPRLVSRFESGLTVELDPPALETRVAILRRKMELWNVELDNQVVFHIADLIKSNVRRLEGALTRVASFSFLSSEAMTIDKVDSLLKDLVRDENSRLTSMDDIQRAVCDHYDLNIGDMSSKRRPASIAFPRQVAMYLCRKLTKHSLVEIGDAFGRRDHGTVIHACKKVKENIESDSSVEAAVETIRTGLQR